MGSDTGMSFYWQHLEIGLGLYNPGRDVLAQVTSLTSASLNSEVRPCMDSWNTSVKALRRTYKMCRSLMH